MSSENKFIDLSVDHLIHSNADEASQKMLPLDDISIRNRDALNYLVSGNPVEEIPLKKVYPDLDKISMEDALSYVPKDITFNGIDHDLSLYLIEIIERGRADLVMKIIPNNQKVHDLQLNGAIVFESLFQYGFSEQIMQYLPEKIDLSQFSFGGGYLLSRIIRTDNDELREGILKKVLPLTTFKGLQSSSALLAIEECGNVDHILKLLPKYFDFTEMNQDVLTLLSRLITFGHADKLTKFFPDQIDVSKLNDYQAEILIRFAVNGQYDLIKRLVENNFNPAALELQSVELIYFLIKSELGDNFFRALGGKINPHYFDDYSDKPLNALINEIFVSIQFDDLFPHMTYFKSEVQISLRCIADLVKNDRLTWAKSEKGIGTARNPQSDDQRIEALLDQEIDFTYVSPLFGTMLGVLCRDQQNMDHLKSRLPRADVGAANDGLLNFLTESITEENAELIAGLLFGSIDYLNLSKSVQLLFIELARYKKSTAEKFIHDSRKTLRAGIDVSNIDTNSKMGLYLFEQIQSLPLNLDSRTELRQGWFRFKLDKGGGSTIHVLLNPMFDPPKVFFVNEDIGFTELEAYSEAAKLLPGYIASPDYPELYNNASDVAVKLKPTGYREIYAGQEIAMLRGGFIPEQINDAIIAQKNFVKLVLGVNGIDHRHPHDRNFNVRFLLTGEGDKKMISFDLNYAIQFAKKNNMTLTPIVTLRDWDLAVSIN